MSALVLLVDLAGWELELMTKELPDHVVELLLLELTRDPKVEVKKAKKKRA